MKGQTDLLHTPAPAIVPQKPTVTLQNRIRLINRVMVPILLRARANDQVVRVPFPIRNTVLGPRQADLRMIYIPKTDIEHHIPIALPNHLTASYTLLLPGGLPVWNKDRIIRVFRPMQPVRTRGITNGVWLVL